MEKSLLSIVFTTFQNPQWKDKINLQLRAQLESETNNIYINQPEGIYAHHGTQLVGGITFQKYNDIIFIDGVWVDEKFKRQGIGKLLIEQLVDIAKKSRIKDLQLNTYFSEAKNFFKASGFEVVNSIPHWKYGLTCYFMRKTI